MSKDNDRGKLGLFLKEAIEWNWAQFCIAEHDPKYTSLEGTVLALVRTASKAKLKSIKLAIDRVDGKLETPMRFEYPKVYNTFPFAKERLTPPPGFELPEGMTITLERLNEPPEADNAKIASMGLRETLEKLADSPRGAVPAILKRKEEIEADPESFINMDEEEAIEKRVPKVKSIIAANLMQLAHDHNFDAISEVFDQIDGKLVEVYRVLGEDMTIVRYAEFAPYDAVKNADGIWQVQNHELEMQWQQKLEQSIGKKGSN